MPIFQLVYNIAGHMLVIETPDARATESLIPTFRPFKDDREVINDPLFYFSGCSIVSIPDSDPVESHFVDGITFKVYNMSDEVVVCMIKDGIEHRISVSANRKRVVSDFSLTNNHEKMFLAYLLRTAYGIASANQKTMKIHASVIEKRGKALIFLGKSGTGKSTHSSLWLEFVPGSTLLNDDEPIIRLMPDGEIRVYGAPWSGSTPCYKNEWAEVTAFVHLRQSPQNRLSRLRIIDSFTSLFQSAAILRSGFKYREQVISLINEILERVPVYRLDNRPDKEAVMLSVGLMEGLI